MEINRRRLLQLLGGAQLLAALPVIAGQEPVLIASAADTGDGGHLLIVMDELGSERLRHTLPDRAHHVAAHPSRPWVAAVARRPGHYIDLVDYSRGWLLHRIEPQPGRHFYGHAIFTADGQGLWATEMDVASGEGRLTLRDLARPQQPVRDFSSGGIGPHELLLSPDGALVVANGGILTDGRDKLNIDSMRPSLAYLEPSSGRILEQRFLADRDHQLSIRHIDINARNEVIIALQYQGDRADDKPLVALHRRGSEIRLMKAPAEINRQMAQYCGSARFDSSGRIAAVSAPRGNLVTFWDVDNNRYLTSLKTADGCGLAATEEPEVFIASSGRGHCYTLYPREDYREPLRLPPQLSSLAWDNHMALFRAVG
ncbi:DUF1513 domain-containing protein [Marinobacterium sp. D7]|uniref:DUF1513 domain-containing protein n=1 Tax=Marinobacterium ramblicola TaxID=2849041 RepID=UPI001C2DCEBD|nr:DUF1513 domain-containing protein [Marinobacterium ramblicola]MBV1789304.1 DUF1513 domain-containing protein [Marinobacterium ramblicola]